VHVPSDWQVKPEAQPAVWQGLVQVAVGAPTTEHMDGREKFGMPSTGEQTCGVGQLADELQPIAQGIAICARGAGVWATLQIFPVAQSASTLQRATAVDCDSLVPQPPMTRPVASAIQSAICRRRLDPIGTGLEVDAARTVVPRCAIMVIG
jgi:hypothetical protein